MKKKLMILIGVVLLAAGGTYKFVLAKPKDAEAAKPKVHGQVYVLPKQFLVNLDEGRIAQLTVGLIVEHGDPSTAPEAEGGHGAAAKPPEGWGTMPQEAVVRDVVTDELTGRRDAELIEREGRERIKKAIAKKILKHTDVKVEEVLLTDVTVQ